MEESIVVWNRLEGSLRNENQLDNALRFEIRDALWMLTRQWQFGELDGEDAATAAFVRIKGEESAIIAAGSANIPPKPFNYDESPLELPIERELLLPDIAARLETGRHWERILSKRLPAPQANSVIHQFRNNVRFQFTTRLPKDPDRFDQFQHAQRYSDDAWLDLTETLAEGRALDGYALLQELFSGKAASVFLPQTDSKVNAAGVEFLQWYDRIFSQNPQKKNTWHTQHLEYQPQLAFAGVDGNAKVLRKEEYYGDGVEWHGFLPQPNWEGQTPLSIPAVSPLQFAETVIPSGVRFRGMPATRLWEMEDGQVDFGAIRAGSTELSKMLFAEFGLVYSNDWLVAPVQYTCGRICRVPEIIVTDIFGKQSVLQEIEPDANWAFFQTVENGKRWLFLPNDPEVIQESQPVEKVCFLRDEMANIVWAVEETISNPYGGGRDAEMAAKQTMQFNKKLQPSSTTDAEAKLSSEGWHYKAGTLMAENRIPFIPIALDQTQSGGLGKRKVVLQRAAAARVADDFLPVRIRPRTTLLGSNGKPEHEKPSPLFVFEEEIPRTGIELSLIWKRARWFDGQTLTWLARKKAVGRGEIDANFRFDQLKKNK